MAEVKLVNVGGCFTAPDGIEPFTIECLAVEDFRPTDIVSGGRTVIVRPYGDGQGGGEGICSGQYGQFQVLNGMGGQIHRALYMGGSVDRQEDLDPNIVNCTATEIGVEIDCNDQIFPSDLGIAIRDRGRWYVVKLGASSVQRLTTSLATVVGGNNNPFEGTGIDTYEVDPYRPFVFPFYKPGVLPSEGFGLRTEWAATDTLPGTWTDSDQLFDYDNNPMLPYGLGWARLGRDQVVGHYSWDADDYEHLLGLDDDQSAVSFVEAFMLSEEQEPDAGPQRIFVAFSRALDGPVPSSPEDAILITSNSEDELGPVGVNGAVLDVLAGNLLTVELNREIKTFERLRIVVGPGFVTDSEGNPTPQAGGVVIGRTPQHKYVPIVNYEEEAFVRGQQVELTGGIDRIGLADAAEGEEAFRDFYVARARGEPPQVFCEVFGGTTDGEIFSAAEIPTIGSWADAKITEEFPTAADIPSSIPAGIGYAAGYVSDTALGDAPTGRSKAVLVANRLPERTLAAGSKIQLVNPKMVADAGGGDPEAVEYRMVWNAYTDAGVGGDASYITASVQGILSSPASHFSSPAPPIDWTTSDLPISYKHGDQLPGNLPRAVAWARLRYPADNIDGKSGTAVDENITYGEGDVDYDGLEALGVAKFEVRSGNEIWVWCSHPITYTNPDDTAWGEDLSDFLVFTHLADPLIVITPQSAYVSPDHDNLLVVDISGLSDDDWDAVFEAGPVNCELKQSNGGNYIVETSGANILPITGQELATYAFDRAAYVLVVNRVYDYDIADGSALSINPTKSIVISDEQDPPNQRTIYDIVLGAVNREPEVEYAVATVDGVRSSVVVEAVSDSWVPPETGRIRLLSDSDGRIRTTSGLTILDPGVGYLTAPAVTLPGGGAVAVTISGGRVAAVKITDCGDYIGVPSVNFTGGGGSGASGYAVVYNQRVVAVVMTSYGTGYTSAPTVEFGTTNEVSPASAEAVWVPGAITAITVTNPGSIGNYPPNTFIFPTVAPPDTGQIPPVSNGIIPAVAPDGQGIRLLHDSRSLVPFSILDGDSIRVDETQKVRLRMQGEDPEAIGAAVAYIPLGGGMLT